MTIHPGQYLKSATEGPVKVKRVSEAYVVIDKWTYDADRFGRWETDSDAGKP